MLVLCIAMLVTVIGVAAVTAARLQLRSATLSNDAEEARLYAQSAVELTKEWCLLDPTWRDGRKVGPWVTGAPIGGGSFSVSVDDPVDGDIVNNPLDPILVTAIGFKGRARQQINLTLAPAPVAVTSLHAAVFSAGALTVNTGRLTTNGLAGSNGNMVLVSANSAQLDANAEVAGTFTGTGYLGNRTAGVAPRNLPDPSSAFNYYLNNGTSIPYGSCSGDLNGCLLSPANNPFGPTNPNGIYVMDCQGNQARVRGCRIVGTLVLLNARDDSVISDQVNLAPAIANYPVLLVKGNFSIVHDSAPLTELNANFNPPSTPYNNGSNSTRTDSYPSAVNGLVYITGDATLNFAGGYNGCVVAGGVMRSDGSVTIGWDHAYLRNPPPGFFDPPPMKVVNSTWAQSVQ